jgi:hypothetical protein
MNNLYHSYHCIIKTDINNILQSVYFLPVQMFFSVHIHLFIQYQVKKSSNDLWSEMISLLKTDFSTEQLSNNLFLLIFFVLFCFFFFEKNLITRTRANFFFINETHLF